MTTIVTVLLLGVLIPVFQATQAKNANVRDQLSLRVFLYDDATNSEIQDLRRADRTHPARRVGRSTSTKDEALNELQGGPPKDSGDVLQQLNSNPLPRNFNVKADDAQQPRRDPRRDLPAGAERQAAADQLDRRQGLRPPARTRTRSSRSPAR